MFSFSSCLLFLFFFFSSRRRHTRLQGDWSSDVCSSDLFRLYFRQVLPRLGTWISGVRGPYQYLPDSVSRFPDQEALAEAMRAAGFAKVRYRDFTGGVAALHIGQKEAGVGEKRILRCRNLVWLG